MSEMMTIVIVIFFYLSHRRDFKNFYLGYLSRFFKKEFPNLLSYNQFTEVIPDIIVPISSYFTTLRGKPTGIEFVDLTSIKVCHNLRIPRHRTFCGITTRDKGTMGWFYGFKLNLLIND